MVHELQLGAKVRVWPMPGRNPQTKFDTFNRFLDPAGEELVVDEWIIDRVRDGSMSLVEPGEVTHATYATAEQVAVIHAQIAADALAATPVELAPTADTAGHLPPGDNTLKTAPAVASAPHIEIPVATGEVGHLDVPSTVAPAKE